MINTIRKSKDYNSSAPIFIYNSNGLLGGPTVDIIPPINTSINFTGLNKYKLPSKSQLLSASVSLPRNYDLRQHHKITSVGNQERCGSCWAYSSSQAISDIFIIKHGFDPNVSAMYLMTSVVPECRQQICNAPNSMKMCAGGNPGFLLQQVETKGTASNHCVDYSACDNNDKCSGSGTQHFETSPYAINQTFPSNGCYLTKNGKDSSRTDPNVNHFKFFIKNVNHLQTLENQVNYNDVQTAVKQHIYNIGTCVGGFNVLSNFLPSHAYGPKKSKSELQWKSDKNPDNIYIDLVDYSSNSPNRISSQKLSAVGGHAVCIIGWGVGQVDSSLLDKDVTKNKIGLIDVPYFLVRNSWGNTWNGDGTFKIAMYPYNKISQFEASVNGKSLGGIITFEANNYKPSIFLQNDGKGYNKNNKSKYIKDPISENISNKNISNKNISKNSNHIFIIVLFIVIILLISFYIFTEKNK
jgi:hypothetical protein